MKTTLPLQQYLYYTHYQELLMLDSAATKWTTHFSFSITLRMKHNTVLHYSDIIPKPA